MIKSRLSITLFVLPILFLAGCRTTEIAAPEVVKPSLAAIPAVAVQVEAPAAPSKVVKPVAASEPERVRDVDIVLRTSMGDIEATLFATKAPVTVASFLNLAKRGYYDGLTFHRVIPNFMIQGGDPTGTGRGGPGYQFEDEIHPALRHTQAGLLSMANAGRGTNGSQFFVTHNATPWLDGKHTIFGKVTKGQLVVDAIRQGATINRIDVLGSTVALFKEQQQRIAQWNTALNLQGL